MRNKYRIAILLFMHICVFWSCKKDTPKISKKVNVLFTTTGLGDLSFSDNLYKGILKARNDFDFEVEYAFPANLQEASTTLKNWIDHLSSKDELIILLGHEYRLSIDSLQGNFNNKKILLIDAKANDFPNLFSIEFSFYGAAFLAGIAAKQITLNDTAGIIAGMPLPPIETGIAGFSDGYLHANGKHTDVQYIGNDFSAFQDIDKAAALAGIMFKKTNLIFGMASNANQGIFDVLRRTDYGYALGVDQDQSWVCPDKIMGSVVKQIDIVASNYVRSFVNGDFHSGYQMAGLESNYMGFLINTFFAEKLQTIMQKNFDDALMAEKKYLEKKKKR